jgi:hypothetical protein
LKILSTHFTDLDLTYQNEDGNTPFMLACDANLEDVALDMLHNFHPDRLDLFAVNHANESAMKLAVQNKMKAIYFMIEDIEDGNITYNKKIPEEEQYIPEEIPIQFIDVNDKSFDVVEYTEKKISDYIREDKNNIAIKVNDKVYLSSREILSKQTDDAIVYECAVANDRTLNNINTQNPLYNLKMVGVDVPTDKVGIVPEYIYYFPTDIHGTQENGIQYILNSTDTDIQLFSVVPAQMLVSVISHNEYRKIGTNNSYVAASSLHCQAGQGGLAGIIVPAYPTGGVAMDVGGRKNRKTKRNRKNKNYKNKNHKNKKHTQKRK